jgi:hypothetical protein
VPELVVPELICANANEVANAKAPMVKKIFFIIPPSDNWLGQGRPQ